MFAENMTKTEAIKTLVDLDAFLKSNKDLHEKLNHLITHLESADSISEESKTRLQEEIRILKLTAQIFQISVLFEQAFSNHE